MRSSNPNRQNPPDVDFRQRGWYRLSKKQEKTVFTSPYVNAATGELLLSVVSSATAAGQLKGVVGGDISLDVIAKSVNAVNFDNTGYAFLVDGNGKIITHQNSKFNGQALIKFTLNCRFQSRMY